MAYTISIKESEQKAVQDTKSVPFGKIPTDHMFLAHYADGQWQSPGIVPFQDLTLSPLALCLHYGQTVFEGMKAFRMADGLINVFRLEKHYQRFLKSLDRMCMPHVPQDLFNSAICELVRLDADWVPAEADGSLYIRPFMIATEPRVGVKIGEEYLFMVVCTPAYQYYSQPLKVKVETHYTRAADGGTGEAKCGGNYGGAFYPTQLAREAGFDQVIWTDAKTHHFIEESGTMNVMFIMDGKLITPALSGSILDGVTRDSLITLAKEAGLTVEVRPIAVDELSEAFESGKNVIAFGAGTAAVIAPIQSITIGDKAYDCDISDDAPMYRLRDQLSNVRKGLVPDTHNWNTTI